jgi:hypothetical protein
MPPNPAWDPTVAAMKLTSIELAVVAELNLEIASGYDEVAEDPKQQSQTRRRARDSAFRRRLRARLLHLEAQRLGAQPTLSDEQLPHEQGPPYSGPERRKYERRSGERRGRLAAPSTSGDVDRRVNRDRRRAERRRQGSRFS